MTIIKKTCVCGKVYTARQADLNRGWGKSCSKSCAAKKRNNSSYYEIIKRKRYELEYGGVANFDGNGEYTGFQCTGFDNTKNQ